LFGSGADDQAYQRYRKSCRTDIQAERELCRGGYAVGGSVNDSRPRGRIVYLRRFLDMVNIYVGNLSFNTDDEGLREAFEAYGEVSSAAVIKDKFSGRSRGFGFVEMPVAAEGQAAIEGLNGSDLDGRALKVNEARPREERPQSNSGGQRGGGSGGRRNW
jgi:RNA recognition motif-containing protein